MLIKNMIPVPGSPREEPTPKILELDHIVVASCPSRPAPTWCSSSLPLTRSLLKLGKDFNWNQPPAVPEVTRGAQPPVHRGVRINDR